MRAKRWCSRRSDTCIRHNHSQVKNNMRYRRNYQTGGLYFFTLVTEQLQPILTHPDIRQALRQAVQAVRQKYPFEIIAWVLLPDHLHTIWQIPDGDANYSERWRQIKRFTQYHCRRQFPKMWQKRFWEHTIRDEEDFAKHMDYLHFNPVKHGYAEKVRDWPYSTLHRYVRHETCPADWGGSGIDFAVEYDD